MQQESKFLLIASDFVFNLQIGISIQEFQTEVEFDPVNGIENINKQYNQSVQIKGQRIKFQLLTQMETQQNQNFKKTLGMFSLGKDNTLPTQYIYDETYKNYKIKHKFQKDPKYSYFNAVMQMKRKLSSKEQVYKNVFESKQNQEHNNYSQERKTFYVTNSSTDNSFIGQLPDNEVVRIQKLKKNSFKIMKQQPSLDTLLLKNRQAKLHAMNRTGTVSFKRDHMSNMSFYDKNCTHSSHMSFQMTTKARNNKSYVQFQVKEKGLQNQRNPYYIQQSFNPKPRLDQIMSQYRKMNSHSHKPKSRKSSLPKEFIQKLYMTNRMFASTNGKKRTSLY